jgi:hypothetical protein
MASNEDDRQLESQGPIAEKDYAQLLRIESTLGQKASRVFLPQGGAIAE